MLFIKNGHIRTMAGPDIEKGCILLGDDGKIVSMGQDILPPEGAQIIDAQGRLVTPGCVEAHCHLQAIFKKQANAQIHYQEHADG